MSPALIFILIVAALIVLAPLAFWLVLRLNARRARTDFPPASTFVITPDEPFVVERTPGGLLTVRWPEDAGAAQVWLSDVPDADPVGEPVATATRPPLMLHAPDARRRAYVTVETSDGQRWQGAERYLPIVGGLNYRDLGGYRTANGQRVRWNRVLRAGELAALTPHDLTYLANLGLKLVCDVRTDEEVAHAPDRVPDEARHSRVPAFVENPVEPGLRWVLGNRGRFREIFADGYVQIAEENAAFIGAWLTALADAANQPALVHCTAGKDRAGLASAFLLAALGVPDDVIVADYSLSNHAAPALFKQFRTRVERFKPLGLQPEEFLPLFYAEPAYLQAVLDHVRERYGDADTYLTQRAGVSAETLARLRQSLLLPA